MEYRFRWVFCQLETLDLCLSPSAVRRALESLPDTLDETYSQILADLPKPYLDTAMRLLQFLAFSERPLRIDEAVDMLAVESRQRPRFKIEDRMPRPEEIIRYCKSLVVITDRQTKNDKYDQGKTMREVQLAHFSVQTYLVSEQVEDPVVKRIQATARATITEICLAYLLELEGLSIRQICASYPLAEFAARYWASQASRLDKRSPTIDQLVFELLTTTPKFQICYRLYAPDMWWDKRSERRQECCPLYYASLCGLSSCVQDLLTRGADVNAQGGFLGNPLQAASDRGHLDIVQILLEQGAVVNAKGGDYGNALQAASFSGHLDIVQVLLEKGADVNAQGGRYNNALLAASGQGYLDIVQILFEKGVDIKNEPEEYNCYLQVASYNGHLDIVQVLLEKGADINAQGTPYGNALQVASDQGHLDIVQVLLEKGADVNAEGGDYGNALKAALEEDHVSIVQVLLMNGAKNQEDEEEKVKKEDLEEV